MTKTDPPLPHRPADDAARAEARRILAQARHATLAVLDEGGWPMQSRIALQADAAGQPLALLSGLALHTRRLAADPRAALLIAPLSGRGSPMAQPRLSLQVRAQMAEPGESAGLRALWRMRDPKSAVYLDLPDFRFWRMHPRSGLLNAGFGRAWLLDAADLTA
ncbi:MAG TPA: pyridoxamine 5'-phosphate oxidase family protein [Paracoccus sp. (in: a-proteobacteria)]|nr:pyridoxamine 5'-phosphate oxidase family protein [Paracoccus sp. (in: a-proteobacteria)]